METRDGDSGCRLGMETGMEIGDIDWRWTLGWILGMETRNGDWGWRLGMETGDGDCGWRLGMETGDGDWGWRLGI